MTWSIGAATPQQAEVLAAIHATAFPPREAWSSDAIALQLVMPGSFGLIEPEGGMLLARVAADEAEVLTLAVLPHRRGQGLGRALLNRAMAEAYQRGAASMMLEVAVDNAEARALYARAGFTQVGRRNGYYADGSDALVLRAELGASPSG